jgi:hypothetical protein
MGTRRTAGDTGRDQGERAKEGSARLAPVVDHPTRACGFRSFWPTCLKQTCLRAKHGLYQRNSRTSCGRIALICNGFGGYG